MDREDDRNGKGKDRNIVIEICTDHSVNNNYNERIKNEEK